MFQPLGMNQAQMKEKGLWGSKQALLVTLSIVTKVTKLERNALLGRGMDLNSLTWLLVTCVFLKMYTTLTLIQSACSSGDATTRHPDQVHLPIFNTLHFTISVGGGGGTM